MNSIKADGFPDAYFLSTKDISSLNNYFPILFLLNTLVSTSSTTNNDQSRLPCLISHFNGNVKYNVGFCL